MTYSTFFSNRYTNLDVLKIGQQNSQIIFAAKQVTEFGFPFLFYDKYKLFYAINGNPF